VLLGGPKTEPARTIRRTEIAGTNTGGVLDSFLSLALLLPDEAGGFEREERMGVRVIADLVSSAGHFASHSGQAADIRATLKEGGRDTEASQDFEQLGGGFTGSIVKGKRNGGPSIRNAAFIDGGSKPGARWDANSVSQSTSGHNGNATQGSFDDFGHAYSRPMRYE
jgi:hypothetical protein